MARIRTIKPEFPQSETIGKLSRDARLLFIQLWTLVDDLGRARAASRMLASLLYPYDADAADLIDGWLDELEQNGCVHRYEVEGSRFLEIPNWLKHQKIDRPSPSKFPAFDEDSTKAREASRSIDADLGPRKGPRRGVEREKEEQQPHASENHTAEKPLPETLPGRRQELDALEATLREAAGLVESDATGLMTLGPILGLLEAGADLHEDILPVLRAKANANRKGRSWAFYVDAVHDAINARRATSAKSLPPAVAKETSPAVWRQWVEGYREKRSWLPALGPDPASPACRAPPDILAAAGFGPASLSEVAA